MARKNRLNRKRVFKLSLLPSLAWIVFVGSAPDAWAQFKWTQAVETGSPGVGQSIASDGNGEIVAVAQTGSEVKPGGGFHLSYSAGQYNASATPTIKWGPKLDYAVGTAPNVAAAYCAVRTAPTKKAPALTCNTGIVAVHEGGGGPVSGDTSLWYRVGVISGPSDNPIVWKAADTQYGNGQLASVAISGDASTIVEVHDGATAPNNTWYRVGKVDWNTGTVKWGASTKYGTGYAPIVAISGSKALVVHGPYGTPKTGDMVYAPGDIDSSSLTISGLSPTVYDSNVDDSLPVVATTSCELAKGQPVVEVHDQGTTTNTALYRTGTFDGKTLTLGPSQTYLAAGTLPGALTMGSDGVPITRGPTAYYIGTSLCPAPPIK